MSTENSLVVLAGQTARPQWVRDLSDTLRSGGPIDQREVRKLLGDPLKAVVMPRDDAIDHSGFLQSPADEPHSQT